ncbi:helix-turn-helix domain-containing protein [Citrobacter werkmanii]|uniref:helix-turn-helix domain-containing protein n=1 Tax=Citrobacter werkmanii TaxID=67827 RepID=UPI0026536890|nr:helix-turn-helix domain-containing protein [Citrobacter werkmanii]MDN8559330.1 helix-turn-helix domain-containing protein [Citrobacter werkmanii]
MTAANLIHLSDNMGFRPVHLARPVESISKLMEAARPFATQCDLPQRRFLDIPSDEIWLVDSGMASIYRNQGQQLVFISAPPFIMGIKNIFYPPTEVYTVEFKETKAIYRLSTEKFTSIIDKENLWRDMTHLMSFYFIIAMENTFRLIKRNDYDVIKSLILEYAFLAEHIKNDTTLAKYIVEKGMISRSNAMRILSILNKYGYITITRGRLMNVDYLPEML